VKGRTIEQLLLEQVCWGKLGLVQKKICHQSQEEDEILDGGLDLTDRAWKISALQENQ